MKKLKKERKITLFFNMIFPYVCVLIIPMLVWLGSNFYVTSNNEKRVVSLVTSNIKNSVSAVDATLSQIENTVASLSNNAVFNDFFEKRNLTYAEKVKYQKLLSSYSVDNGVVKDIYLYSSASGLIIDQESIYNVPELFFQYKCGFDFELVDKWTEITETMSYNNGYMFDNDFEKGDSSLSNVLPYLRTVPIEYPTKRVGMVGVLLEKDELLKSFEGLSENSNAEIYVFDAKGKSVMSHGKNYDSISFFQNGKNHELIKINGDALHKFIYTSPKTKWKYNVLVKENSELRDIVIVNNVLNIVNYFTFFIGILVCIYITFKKHRSYVDIMEALGLKHGEIRLKKNEFDVLKPYVENLVEESSLIKKNMEKLYSTAGIRALHVLLTSKDIGEDILSEMCKDGGISFRGQKFVVMVIKNLTLYNPDAINNEKMFLRHCLKEYIAEDLKVYNVDARLTAVIIDYDMDETEFAIQLRNRIAKMNLDVFHRYHSEFVVGISEPTDRLAKIAEKYSQAMEVVSYNVLISSKSTLFYEELPSEDTMYYYPIELEKRFINAISNSDVNDALRVVDMIYANNFETTNLAFSRIGELFQEILSSLNKIRKLYFFDEERISYQLSGFTVNSFFEFLKDFVFSACENMGVIGEDMNNVRFKEILEYIDKNYSNNALSLTSIAREFGFSDISNLSKYLKKYMKENFSSYLERIRIEKACEMLRAGMPVKDVSEKSGYLSDISFRRVFKKRMGMLPTEYVKERRK